MAKLPGCLKFVRWEIPPREGPDRCRTNVPCRMIVRVRWWHPGAWCLFVRTFMRIYRCMREEAKSNAMAKKKARKKSL